MAQAVVAKGNVPSVPSSEGGLSRYLADIRKYPMLEPDQEYMLSKRFLEHDDSGSAEKLVTSHLRLVAKIAMGYRGYGLPIGEVIHIVKPKRFPNHFVDLGNFKAVGFCEAARQIALADVRHANKCEFQITRVELGKELFG